jgi:periplasmic protein CpxP/Spy
MKKLLVLFASIALLLASPSYAEYKKHHRMHFKQMIKGLDLSGEQKDKIRAIMQSSRQDMKRMRGDMRMFRKQIKGMAMNDEYDSKKAAMLIDKKAGEFAAMMKLRMNRMHQVFSVLTPEQKQKLKNMMQQRQMMRMKRRHHE